MIRIICSECKNAYLQNKGDKYVCPSCGATVGAETENLILGIQNYNEANLSEAADCLMKHIVKNGAEPRAIFYKALCDALQTIDSDTDSLGETYEKLLDCFKDLNKEDYPQYIALANDEMKKIERELASFHVRSLENADAEKIKAEVSAIIDIQKEAHNFRLSLIDIVNAYNETAHAKLSARFSECFLVGVDVATETGNKTYNKIIEDISNHTVFTGILSNNIKNLEIYLRCIVRFFKKSHDKYEFLKAEAQKFNELATLLEKGQYNTIKGVDSISEKLVKESYDFLYESYNEHYDEQIEMQRETVVILEPEVIEEPVTETKEVTASETIEEISEETGAEAVETAETEVTEENADFVLVVDTDEHSEETTEPAEKTNEDIVEETEAVSEENIEKSTDEPAEITQEIITDDDIIEIEVDNSQDDVQAEEPVIEDISSSSVEEASSSEIKTLADIKAEATAEQTETQPDEAAPDNAASDTDDTDTVITIEAGSAETSGEEEAQSEAEKPTASRKKKSKKGKIIFIVIIIAALAFAGYKYIPGIINNFKYEKATTLASEGNFTEAIAVYKELGNYSDSEEKIKECTYNNAVELEEAENFAEAKAAYESLGEYKDCLTRVKTCAYNEALLLLDGGKYDDAAKLFSELSDYGNSQEMVKECSYRKALALTENGEYENAIELLTTIKGYSDVADKINEAKYLYVTNNLDEKNKTTVKYLNELTKAKYRNSAELRKELLGSTEVPSADVKAFVNYDVTDLKTSLTELDNTRPIYFHVVVNDKALYGKNLTLKYTTQFGYSQTDSVNFSESNNSSVMAYPSTQHKNYKVVFELLNTDGTKIASQTITF